MTFAKMRPGYAKATPDYVACPPKLQRRRMQPGYALPSPKRSSAQAGKASPDTAARPPKLRRRRAGSPRSVFDEELGDGARDFPCYFACLTGENAERDSNLLRDCIAVSVAQNRRITRE